MKKSIFSVLLLLALVMLIGISCKSTPEEIPTSELTGGGTQVEAPSGVDPAVFANASEARKRAMDFESPSYFPSEWEALEAIYRSANDTASFAAVAAGYDALFKKTAPLYAQAREDEIMAVRDELIAKGFRQYAPEYLRNADDLALSALDKYEADDYYGARDSAKEALDYYNDLLLATNIYNTRQDFVDTGLAGYASQYLRDADNTALTAIDEFDAGDYTTARKTANNAWDEYKDLLFGAEVYLKRDEIINRGFARYDRENFSKADEIALAAIDEFDAGNKEAARAGAEEAMLRYNLVLSNGWTAYARERQSSASRERELALQERANVASRETFRSAEDSYNQGERLFSSRNYSDSALTHMNAEAMYAISRQETRERRLKAEEAIRQAEEVIEQSNEAAIEAERIIEGGSK